VAAGCADCLTGPSRTGMPRRLAIRTRKDHIKL
jgi:hypothetical protein